MNGSSSRRLGRFVVAATLVATGIVVASFTPLASGGVALAAQTITTLPEPALAVGGLIDGSSCVAGPVCVMIGWNHHGNTGYLWAERWSDGKWSRLPAPPNSTVGGANAQTISCASTQWCMMTSSSAPQVGNKPIADVLDGSHWTTVPIPIVKGSTDLALYKLECQSPTWCVGVGSYVANKKNYLDATFLVSQVWNGVGWHIVPIVSPRTNAPQVDPGMVAGGDHPTASPQELSCVSKKFCVIAGFWIGVFVEQWNGHRWSEVAAPNDASRPGYDSEFSGGTCISTTDCVAVGGYAVSNGKWRPLIETVERTEVADRGDAYTSQEFQRQAGLQTYRHSMRVEALLSGVRRSAICQYAIERDAVEWTDLALHHVRQYEVAHHHLSGHWSLQHDRLIFTALRDEITHEVFEG